MGTVEFLVGLKEQVDHSAGAVFLLSTVLVHTLEDSLLLIVELPELVIREVAVATLV